MKRAFAVLVFAVSALAAPRVARAQNGTWVDVERREPLTAGRTTDDVKRDALHAALADAVRRVVGVTVQGTELSVRADSAGHITDRYSEAVRLDAAGRATDWKMLREEWKPAPKGSAGAPVYVLALRVQVEREAGAADPGFSVRIELNAARLMVRGNEPRDNDELVARVTPTRDSYLTVVLIADDSVFVLAPSAYLASPFASAARATDVPPADLRSAGLRFRAALPAGVTSRSETVAVIATKRPVPINAPAGAGQTRDTGVLTLAEFNRWLVGIPLAERAIGHVTVEIMKRPDLPKL